MIKPNFKKMYLISDEKYQALMANSSQTNSNSISISSQNRAACNTTETKQNNDQAFTAPDVNLVRTNAEIDQGKPRKCECDIGHQCSNDEKVSTKSLPVNKMFKTPFRKILTRKYRFHNKERMQKIDGPKRKREISSSASDDEGRVIPYNNKKKKSKDNQIKPQKSKSHTKQNTKRHWLNLK